MYGVPGWEGERRNSIRGKNFNRESSVMPLMEFTGCQSSVKLPGPFRIFLIGHQKLSWDTIVLMVRWGTANYWLIIPMVFLRKQECGGIKRSASGRTGFMQDPEI